MSKALRILTVTILAAAALTAATGTSASAASKRVTVACSGQTYSQPFRPWLDPANYVPLQNGALESTSGWKLSNGARLVAGNESYHVHSALDKYSLSLPSGSSATSPPLCMTLLHPDLRFFAINTGSAGSTLKVEAITTLAGVTTTTPIGLLSAAGSWQPTLPLPFLDNLLSPLTGTVAFRFTPIGSGSGWRIDDTYVDPYKSR